MRNNTRHRIAEEAAKFLAEGVETEYLHAKERALLKLGISGYADLPPNSIVKNYVEKYTRCQLGEEETKRRLAQMRKIALDVMTAIEPFEPHLFGSTISGKIRPGSDIDLHAYSDHYLEIKDTLGIWGYEDVEEEEIENQKGYFLHLKWLEQGYPVEITVYPWGQRDTIFYSSIDAKPIKRLDLHAVRHTYFANKKEKT
jgi:predicted nucleotidyltransferase